MPITRRSMLAMSAAAMAAVRPFSPPAHAAPRHKADKLDWHDVTTWGVEGRGWEDEQRERWFDRLPAEARTKVRQPVWDLSRHAAGMSVRFNTDASAVHVRYKLMSASLAMPHMPATGCSGLDLYARDSSGAWRWASVTRPSRQEDVAAILTGIGPGMHQYLMYLPLWNGVDSLEIGVAPGAKFEPIAPRREKPIVFYGTSIMHGACASRPGMAIPAILGRRLDVPTINLGFSGNGRMEKEVGEFLVRLDPSVYVIDCNPNLKAAEITARAVPLVQQLRAARPATPILLVEDRRNANSWLTPSRKAHHDANHAALRAAYEQMIDAGVRRLYYLPGDDLLGADHDGTTDGSHPNDLGFVRYADAYEPVLRRALGK